MRDEAGSRRFCSHGKHRAHDIQALSFAGIDRASRVCRTLLLDSTFYTNAPRLEGVHVRRPDLREPATNYHRKGAHQYLARDFLDGPIYI